MIRVTFHTNERTLSQKYVRVYVYEKNYSTHLSFRNEIRMNH
jgi:hypothetical protein